MQGLIVFFFNITSALIEEIVEIRGVFDDV